jgi:hypothetical protein
MPVPALHFRVSYRRLARPQAFTKSASRFAATVSLASVRPLAAISSTERRMRVASGWRAISVQIELAKTRSGPRSHTKSIAALEQSSLEFEA